MKRSLFLILWAVSSLLPVWAQPVTPPKTHLKVGDDAPDFTITGKNSSAKADVHLADYRGKKNVVLAFFPAAFTGG